MEHFSAPKFGIEDILLPEGHYTSEAQNDVLAGQIKPVDAYFRMTLLYSPQHVSRQVESLKEFGPYMSEPLAQVDFGVPTDGISLACKTSSNLEEEDTYRVSLKSRMAMG